MNTSPLPRMRLPAGQAVMSAHDFLARPGDAVFKDLKADPSLLDDLMAAAGPGSTAEYRRMLAAIWHVAAKVRPQSRHTFMQCTATGSTFDLLTTIIQQTLTYDMEPRVVLDLLGEICGYIEVVIKNDLQEERDILRVLKSAVFSVIDESVQHGNIDHLKQVIQLLRDTFPSLVDPLVSSESLSRTVVFRRWNDAMNRNTPEQIENTEKYLRETFTALVDMGADLNAQVDVAREVDPLNTTRPTQGPLVLALAWCRYNETKSAVLADCAVESGANWEGLINDPKLDANDRDVLLQVPAIRRRSLAKHTQSHSRQQNEEEVRL